MTSFTVVGEFPDETTASNVEQIITHLFVDIVKFQEEHNYYVGYSRKETPTWPEIDVSEKYNIPWEKTLDWIQMPVPRHVTRFKNLVFITTELIKGWKTPDQIEQLLKKLTDQVYVKADNLPELIILTELNCITPQRAVAIDIVAEINLYLLNKDVEYLIPPWEMYSPFLGLFGSTDLGLLHDFEPDLVQLQRTVDALYNYQKAKLSNQPLMPLERTTMAELEKFTKQHKTLSRDLSPEMLPKIIRDKGSVSGASGRGKKVEVAGQLVRVPELFFFHPELGIPAIHTYLTTKGCTDIEIALKSVPYASMPEYI